MKTKILYTCSWSRSRNRVLWSWSRSRSRSWQSSGSWSRSRSKSGTWSLAVFYHTGTQVFYRADGDTGTAFPIGSPATPVNNLVDARLIAALRGIHSIVDQDRNQRIVLR